MWQSLGAGVPNPGCRLVPVHYLLGTGQHSRRWAVSEQTKLHLLFFISLITSWTIPHPPPSAREKLSSMKPLPDARKIGNSCLRRQFRVCVCVCVCVCTLSRVWLCDPMGCNLLGSSVHRIFSARIMKQVTISSSRESFWPRDQPMSLASPTLAGGFFTTVSPGKPHFHL